MGWRKKAERARRLHRPSLRNWERDGIYKIFPEFAEKILSGNDYQSFLLPGVPHVKGIPVVLDARTLEMEFFANKLEAKGIPCVITHVPEVEEWPAAERWQLETLERDRALRDRAFKCGEDDDGRSIKM